MSADTTPARWRILFILNEFVAYCAGLVIAEFLVYALAVFQLKVLNQALPVWVYVVLGACLAIRLLPYPPGRKKRKS